MKALAVVFLVSVLTHTTYLPVVQGSNGKSVATCEHPKYNELTERVGETVCYEEAYVEEVFQWVTCEEMEGGECVEFGSACSALVSVVHLDNKLDPDDDELVPWYGPVYVEHSGDCTVEEGEFVTFTGEVLGWHTMAGEFQFEGIDVPRIELVYIGG